MSNRVVVIFVGKWGSFENDHLDEFIECKTKNNTNFPEFINRKRLEIGLRPMKYMEYEVLDEQKFLLATIKYGIVSHDLDEAVCG